MTEEIDHSALADSRLATQYKGSPKFRAYIAALMEQVQELEGAFQHIALWRDIDQAEGAALDAIGAIVGVSRIVDGVIVTPFFNFNGAPMAEPMGEEGNLHIGGRFYEEGEATTGSSVLADPEYRLVIRAKIARNHAHGTGDDIISALAYLFGGAPAGVIDDVGGMAIDIGIGRRMTNVEHALITELDILPRPSGVRINRIINYTGGAVFGFEGLGDVLTFGEEGDPSIGGPFAEDVTAGIPTYPEETWTPDSLSGIVDWGIWTDNTRLKQDSSGTTAVTAAGQRIGYWRGQKDVLAFVAEGGTSYRPVLAADGVHFDAPARRLAAVTSMYLNDNVHALTLAAGERVQEDGNARGLQLLAQVSLALSTRVGFDQAAAYAGVLLQPSGYEMAASVGNVAGDRFVVASLPAGNTSRAMTGWVNGTKYTGTSAVVSGSEFTRLVLKTPAALYGNTKAKGWVVVAGTVSDADAANITNWLASL